jgi:hypothetical protein
MDTDIEERLLTRRSPWLEALWRRSPEARSSQPGGGRRKLRCRKPTHHSPLLSLATPIKKTKAPLPGSNSPLATPLTRHSPQEDEGPAARISLATRHSTHSPLPPRRRRPRCHSTHSPLTTPLHSPLPPRSRRPRCQDPTRHSTSLATPSKKTKAPLPRTHSPLATPLTRHSIQVDEGSAAEPSHELPRPPLPQRR